MLDKIDVYQLFQLQETVRFDDYTFTMNHYGQILGGSPTKPNICCENFDEFWHRYRECIKRSAIQPAEREVLERYDWFGLSDFDDRVPDQAALRVEHLRDGDWQTREEASLSGDVC